MKTIRLSTAITLMGCIMIAASPASQATEISYRYDADGIGDRLTIYLSGEIDRGDFKEIVRIHRTVEATDSEEPNADGFIWLPREEALRREWTPPAPSQNSSPGPKKLNCLWQSTGGAQNTPKPSRPNTIRQLPDIVVAFPGGRGTADMMTQARSAGVEVIEAVGQTGDT